MTIPVTKTILPPLEEYFHYLESIWQTGQLTNNGPLCRDLARCLKSYLDLPYLELVGNGTLALQIAIKMLGLKGEIITTPYSYVASTNVILWEACEPVFVDIEPRSFCIDPDLIEAAITDKTSAILATHVYGYPCNVTRIRAIADRHGLKVIYDAAHAFGVKYKGDSLLKHGDLSVLSFHATKVFTTFEGGAIVCPDAKTKQRIDYLKNFGFADEVTVTIPGINGKMSEINAAFGLLQLKHIDQALARRKSIEARYREALAGIAGITLLAPPPDTQGNASYFPILVDGDYPLSRDALYQKMRDAGVYGRRYFYPLISDMPMYRGLPSAKAENLQHARQKADSVICLPIYPSLTDDQIDRVVSLVRVGT